jgi:hypothetical protein
MGGPVFICVHLRSSAVKTTSNGVQPPSEACLAQVMSHLCAPKKDATSRQNATNRDTKPLLGQKKVLFGRISQNMPSNKLRTSRGTHLTEKPERQNPK